MTGTGAMTDDAPRGSILALRERTGEAIIGQRAVIDRLLIGLLSNGNLLVEGLPGARQDALDQGPGEQPGVRAGPGAALSVLPPHRGERGRTLRYPHKSRPPIRRLAQAGCRGRRELQFDLLGPIERKQEFAGIPQGRPPIFTAGIGARRVLRSLESRRAMHWSGRAEKSFPCADGSPCVGRCAAFWSTTNVRTNGEQR